jgi:hypothetical protein
VNGRVEIDDLSRKNALDPFTYIEDACEPQNDSAALIEVDFPVSAGPLHTTTGHPEKSCDKIVMITL